MTTAPITRLRTDGVELAVLTSPSVDDDDRPLVVCLHGFPDTAHTWRHLFGALEGAGMRAVAPFLRGYAPSGVAADGRYQTAASSLDAIALHEHFGGDERAAVVGHDWGAMIAYGAASHDPRRWARVVGLAVPPGPAVAQALLTNPDQLKRSWYMFFFQSPFAELVVPADDLAFIEMLWRDWSPGYDPSDDVPAVRDALRDPANLLAALGYYRAALGDGLVDPNLASVQEATQMLPPQPTLYLHGADDGCIGVEVAESAAAGFGASSSLRVVAGAGHFLHLEDPATVATEIVGFLS